MSIQRLRATYNANGALMYARALSGSRAAVAKLSRPGQV
jgi:hypothetical protein